MTIFNRSIEEKEDCQIQNQHSSHYKLNATISFGPVKYTYRIIIIKCIQHDDRATLVFVYHTPHIYHCVRERHLSQNIGILALVALEIVKTLSSDSRKKTKTQCYCH